MPTIYVELWVTRQVLTRGKSTFDYLYSLVSWLFLQFLKVWLG